ncbi:MAG: YjbQ family protein [Anaerolineaceae bacterium]|nr:YjbQ family protein [Anaerolineaceae bacterium]MBN2677049.1 YjbQ family protein [Anaerolineaceae bacterium]
MIVDGFSLELDTKGNGDVLNINDMLVERVSQTGISNGIVVVFCPSSTSALTTIEYESGCIQDLKSFFERVTPSDMEYKHNQRWGDGNGFSHLRAALLGASLTIPLRNGKLTLGTWQQVVLVDFDNRPRRREMVVQIIGE